ncbi:MAG: hypothetical protein AAFO06_22855 [Cyanobacteria bacterium J06597_16]
MTEKLRGWALRLFWIGAQYPAGGLQQVGIAEAWQFESANACLW